MGLLQLKGGTCFGTVMMRQCSGHCSEGDTIREEFTLHAMLPSQNCLSDPPRAVNNLLHTLRGEQFRHSQNVIRSRTHLLSSSLTQNTPTLPVCLHYQSNGLECNYDVDAPSVSSSQVSSLARHGNAGPEPPKSWTSTTPQKTEDQYDSPAWRSVALSLLFPRQASSATEPTPYNGPQRMVPPLTFLCFRLLLSSSSGPEFADDVAPFIPCHLRRDLVQYSSVWSPLSNARLYALWEPVGHADGELIIVGPQATLRSNFFQQNPRSRSIDVAVDDYQLQAGQASHEDNSSWEDSQHDCGSPPPLHTFVLLTTSLSLSTFLTLSPTITHMGLINLSTPLPIHRLPNICPLLVVLDLSFNKWMAKSGMGDKLLERVKWTRWSRLEVLGLRGCSIDGQTRSRINVGRWNDVQIIQ